MTSLFAALSMLVFCAPGYPGAAGDAQPLVDQFAKSAAHAARWPDGSLGAVYDPTEEGGLTKLAQKESALTFVPYPFYVQHAAQLHLSPLAQADVTGVGSEERWTLIGKAGGPDTPQALSTYTLISVAGYAPEFVRHALAGWPLPPSVKIESTFQVLSALRRVAAGEPVVVLLDQTQTAALPSLPFAAQLKSLTHSEPLPVALIALVNARLPPERAKAFQGALLKLSASAEAADGLAALHLKGFVALKLKSP
jgi:hypothetical protein